MTFRHKKRGVHIFSNPDRMADFAVEKWSEASKKAVEKKGRFTVALSGGRTPVKLYRKLADSKKSLPWDKTHIFMVDERFVPLEHNESNYRMINQTLLNRVPIPSEHVHLIMTDTDNPVISAKKYEDELISFFNLKGDDSPCFDLTVLGIGKDGHTASLFPDSPSLEETGHLAVAVPPSGRSIKERVTLTLTAINNSENVIFLVSGNSKADILKEVVEEKSASLPAARVKPDRGSLFFLIDESAGSRLSRKYKKLQEV